MERIDRPVGVVLDEGGDVGRAREALEGWARSVTVVDAPTVAWGIARALAAAPTGSVWVVPTSAVGVGPDDLALLWSRAGLRGVIATDGVRDVPGLGLWPRAKAAEVGMLARSGGGLSVVTAGMVRVQMPLRVFRGPEPGAPAGVRG